MRAVMLTKSEDGEFGRSVTEVDEQQLPEGDTLVSIDWSTINYKDALAITNSAPVVREFPMVPGIDLAGTVMSSTSSSFVSGDRVVLNGWGVGEAHWGGLAERARIEADWLTPIPSAFSTKQAASIGTAGYTAMLCVQALEDQGLTPEQGPVLVTGAAGGVGSVATALLSTLGYEVLASTGRTTTQADFLRELGASQIIERSELSEPTIRPMAKPRWAGAIDVAGSHTLANVLSATQPRGCVATCGLAQGMDLPASVAPFILRGITLVGIDSVYESAPNRERAWHRLADHLDPAVLESITTAISLDEVPGAADDLLAGEIAGRLVVDPNS